LRYSFVQIYPDVDGRIILKWILRKLEEVVATGYSWLRIGTGMVKYFGVP
jgi:hypothetical protein